MMKQLFIFTLCYHIRTQKENYSNYSEYLFTFRNSVDMHEGQAPFFSNSPKNKNGKSVQVSHFTEHFWSVAAKQCWSIQLNNWSRWRLVLKHRMAPKCPFGVIRFPRSTEIPNWFEHMLFSKRWSRCPSSTTRCGLWTLYFQISFGI